MYEDRIQWIEHKGKRILSLDYSGLNNENLPVMFDEVKKVIIEEAQGSVRYLTNISNINFSVKTISLFNRFADGNKNWDNCGAVLGTSGLIKVMYDGYSKVYSKPLKTFNDKEKALDWLASI